MTEQEVKTLIAEDEDLRDLLESHLIGGFTDFSDEKYNDDALKHHIENAYIQSFNEIFNKNSATNPGKVTALLRSIKHLATPNAKDRIVAQLSPYLDTSVASIEEAGKAVTGSGMINKKGAEKLDRGLDAITIAILNQLADNPTISNYRDKVLSAGLDICDHVAKFKATKDEMRYAMYNAVINNLERLKDKGALAERFNLHKKTIIGKRNTIEVKYVLGVVFLILWIVFKIMRRM